MKRIIALPVLAAALVLALAAAVAVSLSAAVPTASATILGNGCDEYDPDRGITYRCTPDRSTFYTPDGLDPTRILPGTAAYGGDTIGIPPPAPFHSGRDYCSNPWWDFNPFEYLWQRACYNHDVCYGSQRGRSYCDATFWRETMAACKAAYAWYHPGRYACYAIAGEWYLAVRVFGGSRYIPRQTSLEPAGE